MNKASRSLLLLAMHRRERFLTTCYIHYGKIRPLYKILHQYRKRLLLKNAVPGKVLKESFNYKNGFLSGNLLDTLHASYKMTEFRKVHCGPGHQSYRESLVPRVQS